MGCYGIGVSRLISAIAEQKSDERGLVWESGIAPYECMIMISNIKNDSQREIGERLYKKLKKDGVKVLLDDRDERFGAKMTDFELLGIPVGYLIGRSLEEGKVEKIYRKEMRKELIDLAQILGE